VQTGKHYEAGVQSADSATTEGKRAVDPSLPPSGKVKIHVAYAILILTALLASWRNGTGILDGPSKARYRALSELLIDAAGNRLNPARSSEEFVIEEVEAIDLLEQEEEEVSDDAEALTKIVQPFDPAQIRVDSKQLSLDTLLSRIENGEIILQPDFQRQEVWKEDARSRLIESILIRIPLPAFYVDATDEERWLVVDGQQRLSTLRRFVLEGSLPLSGLEFLKDFDGLRFRDLPRQFQRRIKETNVTVYLIEKGTPGAVKLNIFKRINTGGLPLSSQEIRHALNGPPVTTLLKELAESAEFLRATRSKIPSTRMADREYITRFIAFFITAPAEYSSQEFDSFLNDAMKRTNAMSDLERERLRSGFLRSMVIAHQLLGKHAFRKMYALDDRLKPINKALFEAWSVNLASISEDEFRQLSTRRDALILRFIKLMHDRSFEQSVTQGTGDVAKVRLRFRSIEGIIRETLND